MMMWIRAICFNGAFYGWTFLCAVIFLPTLILPRPYILRVAKWWASSVYWICENILGLRLKVIGQDKLLTSPVIFAVKHQSTWETIIFHYFLFDPSIVLKKELLWIPFFGWYLQKLHMVPVSRSKGKKVADLKYLLKKAKQAVLQQRPLIIFPEGTRSKPGVRPTYQSGVASLYLYLNIPVIPIAHNAGLYWPRRGFMKYGGELTLAVLDPIYPGLSRREFMEKLENMLEVKTHNLIQEGLSYATKT